MADKAFIPVFDLVKLIDKLPNPNTHQYSIVIVPYLNDKSEVIQITFKKSINSIEGGRIWLIEL